MGIQFSSSETGVVLKTSPYDIAQRATSRAYETSSWRGYACSIAINNTTEFALRNPSYYCSAGMLDGMPESIESEYTGFLLAESRLVYPEGSCGVISYDIKVPDGRNKKLQIMWSVPHKGMFWDRSSVNIRIGIETANKELFDKMYYRKSDDSAFWCDAVSTPHHIFSLDQAFEAEAIMVNKSKTPLIVELRKRH